MPDRWSMLDGAVEEEKEPSSVWDLFFSSFSLNDEVMVIDDDDHVIVGRLDSVDEKGCNIVSVFSGKNRRIPWKRVTFISHDGFPCRKLFGADGSPSIEQMDTTNTQKQIRTALTHDYNEEKGRWVFNGDRAYRPRRVKNIVRGDPFHIEDVMATIHNPGNVGPKFWCSHFEETLVLESEDGAKANLYALPTVYAVEWAA